VIILTLGIAGGGVLNPGAMTVTLKCLDRGGIMSDKNRATPSHLGRKESVAMTKCFIVLCKKPQHT